MIPSDTRLALIDRATDKIDGQELSPATLTAFVRYLRLRDLDAHQWNRCSDIAAAAGLTHHQARRAVGQLVRAGLLVRNVVQRRLRGQDARYTVYRLSPTAMEGAGQ